MATSEEPRTYLASVVDLPLGKGESVDFSTWDVQVKSVCRVPSGWTIKAAGGGTSAGVLSGECGLGATWFNKRSAASLDKFILLQLVAPVQMREVRDASGVVPATFGGTAIIGARDSLQLGRLKMSCFPPALHTVRRP